MSLKETILIVDDAYLNRQILSRILMDDYDIIEASNGKEALEIYQKNPKRISAILLDLLMPVMDGFTFLEEFKKIEKALSVPIIISTGQTDKENEIKALELGAWDFIGKPFIPEIILFRIKNAILRSQLTALKDLQYKAMYDPLTQIFNKDMFFKVTLQRIVEHPEKKYTFLRFDINRFHLINSYYGTQKGDAILYYIGQELMNTLYGRESTTYGRIEADIFAYCIPTQDDQLIEVSIEKTRQVLRDYPLPFDMVPCFGIYKIMDNNQPIDECYDNATLAAKSCKGNYLKVYAYYDSTMSAKIRNEQQIVNDMNMALETHQFEIWYQPKVELATNRYAGSEALVRWNHPQRGMISPGDFIPVFEHNGFISKLDYYVWEKVCQDIRGWLDEGIEPGPVSVNISRVDLSDPKIVDHIVHLTTKYRVPQSLLNLELTESAYTDNPEKTIEIMRNFQKKGFIIMMDDFGSGYSSLSVLKDIDVNVLKIDMRFFSKCETENRSRSIIASVVRMAKWLGIPVIAEGVEDKKQVEFLRGLNCEYIQGYFFAKPMPKKKYDSIVKGEENPSIIQKQNENNLKTIWENDHILAGILQPAATFEKTGDSLEIIRVNNAFYDLFGYEREDNKTRFQNPLSCVRKESQKGFLKTFDDAYKTNYVKEIDFFRNTINNEKCCIHMRVKFLMKTEDKEIFYAVFHDITSIKAIDDEISRYHEELVKKKSYGKILVVDDLASNREILSLLYQNEYEVMEAENGEDAFQKLEAEHGEFDIILLDLIMPVMNGKEFLKQYQKTPYANTIPVIVITSDDNTVLQAEAIELGASDYIVKPFVSEVVKKRITNALLAQSVGSKKNSK